MLKKEATISSAWLNETLARLDVIDKDQRFVSMETREAPGWTLSQLITRFAEVRNLHARLKEIAADVNQLADHLSMELVPEAMRAAGFTTVNHQVGRVTIGTRVSASMLDRAQAMQWLRDNELGSLIIETVNSQTLGAQAKDMLEKGAELPAEVFKTTVKPYTSITSAGPKRSRKFQPIVTETDDGNAY